MLDLAIKAGLPLIKVWTDDLVNVEEVLTRITGKPSYPMSKIKPGALTPQNNAVYYAVGGKGLPTLEWYTKMSKVKSSLVIVNPVEEDSSMFDAGTLQVPSSMVREFVEKYAVPEKVDALMQTFAGLSYKDMVEIACLAMSEFGEFSAPAIQKIRRRYFGAVTGLQQVSTDFEFYSPSKAVQDWLELDGKLFLSGKHKVLQPRGLLFTGPAGTGKTMGAKYIAENLGVPLYQLDIGMLMSKWVGESEKNLKTSLRQAELYAPCVILIDEVEKLFTQSDDSGVTTRLLSSLLWWLQEHQSKVLTIMTTNDESKIPSELYRPGRIDRKVTFRKLEGQEIQPFIMGLRKVYSYIGNLNEADVQLIAQQTLGQEVSHAELTTLVMTQFKRKEVSKSSTN